jgi:putative transposase
LNADAVSYRGFRYPVEIISHGVWLYYRFPLSLREVEEMMLARGVVVSYETIRQWSVTFGAAYAAGLRRRRPKAGDNWHLDEVFIKVNGQRQYLWRAVDQDGNVLDILVPSRRNTKAATRFVAKLMKKQWQVPRVGVTDKLRSGAPGPDALDRAPPVPVSQQPRGELTPTHPPARTSHERLPLPGSSPAVPGLLQPDITPLPAPPPPAVRHRVPHRDAPPLHNLERDHRPSWRAAFGCSLGTRLDTDCSGTADS